MALDKIIQLLLDLCSLAFWIYFLDLSLSLQAVYDAYLIFTGSYQDKHNSDQQSLYTWIHSQTNPILWCTSIKTVLISY